MSMETELATALEKITRSYGRRSAAQKAMVEHARDVLEDYQARNEFARRTFRLVGYVSSVGRLIRGAGIGGSGSLSEIYQKCAGERFAIVQDGMFLNRIDLWSVEFSPNDWTPRVYPQHVPTFHNLSDLLADTAKQIWEENYERGGSLRSLSL